MDAYFEIVPKKLKTRELGCRNWGDKPMTFKDGISNNFEAGKS